METRNEDAGGKSSTQNDDGKGDPVSLDSPDPPEDDLDDLDGSIHTLQYLPLD